MKKSISIIFIIALIVLFGCSKEEVNEKPTGIITQPQESPSENVEQESQKTEPTQNELGIVEEEGIFISTITINEDDSFGGEIIKNKITMTATAELKYLINDSEEYMDFGDTKTTMTPALVNMMCGVIAFGFFDTDRFQEMADNITMESVQEGYNTTPVDYDEKNIFDFLEGYEIKKATIQFIDFEDKGKIAECTSTGPEFEDITFKAYREYDNSFGDVIIGKESDWGS